jgi:PTH1 family peptidyl-tRNA hydrolase
LPEEKIKQERLIVGLGNPGKKYEMTRHNFGFIAVQALAHELGGAFKEDKRFHGQVAKGALGDTVVYFLMPSTYMNESGRSVKAFVDYYKLNPDQVIVVNDDIELNFGDLRLRPTGSAGGHNGLKSIEALLGTRHYVRLRLGIGRNKEEKLVEYVLDNFTPEELTQLPHIIAKAVAALKLMVSADIAKAMQSVNAKIKSEVKMQTCDNRSGEQKHETN